MISKHIEQEERSTPTFDLNTAGVFGLVITSGSPNAGIYIIRFLQSGYSVPTVSLKCNSTNISH